MTLGVRTLPSYGLDAQAEKLSIRDQDLGEGDLTGQAVRLSLVGSRGITITCLWAAAQDKQKKHQWNELELIVRSLTKLQPHFIAPWRFQSWNLSYNVSVESDRVKDKYFYITRGIDLAAEGERNNRNNPDLRMDVHGLAVAGLVERAREEPVVDVGGDEATELTARVVLAALRLRRQKDDDSELVARRPAQLVLQHGDDLGRPQELALQIDERARAPQRTQVRLEDPEVTARDGRAGGKSEGSLGIGRDNRQYEREESGCGRQEPACHE